MLARHPVRALGQLSEMGLSDTPNAGSGGKSLIHASTSLCEAERMVLQLKSDTTWRVSS